MSTRGQQQKQTQQAVINLHKISLHYIPHITLKGLKRTKQITDSLPHTLTNKQQIIMTLKGVENAPTRTNKRDTQKLRKTHPLGDNGITQDDIGLGRSQRNQTVNYSKHQISTKRRNREGIWKPPKILLNITSGSSLENISFCTG